MSSSIVELVFPRPEAWVVHHALLTLQDRRRSTEWAETADCASLDRLPDRVVDSASGDPITDALRGIEAGRVRFTRREAEAVRTALTTHLTGGPLRDQKPGSDALRRVRRRLETASAAPRPTP